MKHNAFLLACAAILLASCTGNSYKLSGTAPADVKYVYFTDNFFDDEPQFDSVAVVDGKFVIERNFEEPHIVSAALDNNTQFWYVAEAGQITIHSLNFLASGTPQNDAIHALFDSIQTVGDQAGFIQTVENFMQQHPNDLAGAFCLFMTSQGIGLDRVSTILENSGDVVKNIINKVISPEDIEAAKAAAKSAEATAEGQMFTDFEAEYEGKVQKLSDYVGKGKYVLVDFWASWCGPCRGEIPTIIELYNKYAGEKFEVLGVATWDEPEDTKAAIEELGIKYPQIMNAQKAGSDAYGIEGIPQIILFGPDGTILRRDLRGEEMVKAVEEALK